MKKQILDLNGPPDVFLREAFKQSKIPLNHVSLANFDCLVSILKASVEEMQKQLVFKLEPAPSIKPEPVLEEPERCPPKRCNTLSTLRERLVSAREKRINSKKRSPADNSHGSHIEDSDLKVGGYYYLATGQEGLVKIDSITSSKVYFTILSTNRSTHFSRMHFVLNAFWPHDYELPKV